MNKILLSVALFSSHCILAQSFAGSISNFSQSLSPQDRERLEHSKNMLQFLDKKIWMIGMDEHLVEGPKKFIEAKFGLYYTGRLRVVRWGANTGVPLNDYAWNANQGERWHLTREVIYYDREISSYITAHQGPLALDELRLGSPSRTVVILGEEPDWDSFE